MTNNLPIAGICIFASLMAIVVSSVVVSTHEHESETTKTESREPSTFEVVMRNIKYNPASLTIQVGDTVRWINADTAPHTVTPTNVPLWGTPGSGDAAATWLAKGASWEYTFNTAGTFDYYCIPHAAKDAEGVFQGMVGKIIVTEAPVSAQEGEAAAKPGPMQSVGIAEIGADAFAIPMPSTGGHAYIDITSREVVANMADGITYPYWTFDGQVPGRMLRVQQGDLVTVNFTNAADSTFGHNIDFHAVTGPGGGAAALDALPGETRQLTFKALNPGLYVYHCAYQDPPLHVAHGMYGLILVEPAGGLPPVDREYYVMQGDFYTPFSGAAKGHHDHSEENAENEEPTFVVFNGRVGSLRDEERQLQANVGETVRIYFGVGGPNLVSSFHVIGEIFDHVYSQGDVVSDPQQSLQTTLVPAGGAAIVDFRVEVPGNYLLVDHSLYRVHKGAAGILHVAGEAEEGVFEPA